MYMNEESESPEEVLFAAAVPLGMVKNILEEKSLLRDANEELWGIYILKTMLKKLTIILSNKI